MATGASRQSAPGLAVQRAIARAERLLPGTPAPDGRPDPRWRAIIQVGEFIETQPEPVWEFALRWGKHAQTDLRMAIATCILEHLLQHHFVLLFPRVRRTALESPRFADTFRSCWQFGQAEIPKYAAKFKRLREQVDRLHAPKSPGLKAMDKMLVRANLHAFSRSARQPPR